MHVILMGLHGDADEASITEGMGRYFHVRHVEMIRQGDADSPWALIEVHDSYERVWNVCNQLRGVYHRGKRIHLYIPLHQTDVFHEIPCNESLHIR